MSLVRFHAILLVLVITLELLCISPGCISQSDEFHMNNSTVHQNSSFSVTDSLGNNLTFHKPVTKIVSQNGYANELLLDIGAGDKIVGITDTAMEKKYLVDNLPNAMTIGNVNAPSIELLSSLHPDILILYTTSDAMPRNMELLNRAQIRLFYVDCYRITNMSNEAQILGKLIGKLNEAQKYAEFNNKNIALVQSRLQNVSENETIRVYCESSSDYSACSQGSNGDDYLKLLKAKNIAQNISVSGKVSPEWIIKENPDVMIKIISTTGGNKLAPGWEKVANRTGFSQIKAIQDHRFYTITNEMVNSPRCSIGLLYLAKALYPTRFSDIDPDDVLHEYAETFLSGSDQVETIYPSLSP